MDVLNMNSSHLNTSDGNKTLLDALLNDDNETAADTSVPAITLEVYITKAVVNCTILPILAVVGILGNISTIIVFNQKKTKNASTLFIISLAFSDLLVLILRCIANMYAIGHFYFMERMRYVRPFSFFWTIVSYSPQRSGSLFILVIVVERFTAVWFPLKLRLIWTKTTAYVIIAMITLLTLGDMTSAVDVLIFSLNERIPDKGVVSTVFEVVRYRSVQSPIVSKWSFVWRLVMDMLTYPFICIFNLLLLIGIRRSLAFRKGLTSSKQKKNGEQTKTKMLLGMSFLFIVLCSPYLIYIYLVIFGTILGSDVPISVYEIVKMINLLNSVINFVVYGVNDSSLREKYLRLWRCRHNENT